MGMMQIEPLTYIRGRSIPNQYIVVDEAQNLTPHEVKTVLTRAARAPRSCSPATPTRSTTPTWTQTNNGLVHMWPNRFQNERIAGTVTLSKGERSGAGRDGCQPVTATGRGPATAGRNPRPPVRIRDRPARP
jgi:PhoH-like ATPase